MMRRITHTLTRPWLWLGAACFVYLLLGFYQLGLPGIHYDEAKEAGVNAVELLRGDPVTPFRNAALTLFGRQFPLMVQDYIGALNVYLAVPMLAASGVGVPNLRVISLLTGLAVLPLAAYAVSEWQRSGVRHADAISVSGPTWGGVLVAWLLAASPSFIFWSRQGIFVTNLMQPLCLLALWQGARWLSIGRRHHLWWALLAAGFALYAKLLAVWIIGPWLLLLAVQWLWAWRRGNAPRLDVVTWLVGMCALLLPLVPFLIFNLQTGGTLQALLGNAGESYYGVDNLAFWRNGGVRLQQWAQSLRGDQFWYLGGLYGNALAPWLVAGGVVVGFIAAWRRMVEVVLIALLAVAASCFTISDLFITHYALIQPITLAAAALGFGLAWQRWGLRESARWLVVVSVLLVVMWVGGDLSATVRYHQALSQSGGLADHSDASYHLAYHLRYNGLGAPIALDWGIDAPVRFLSENTVRPIEIFGYASPSAPDADFEARLTAFLENPHNIYVLHAPGHTTFLGRREAFMNAVAARGLVATLERSFTQRDGSPIYELWRVGGDD